MGQWAMGGEARKDLESLETSSSTAHCLHVSHCAGVPWVFIDFIFYVPFYSGLKTRLSDLRYNIPKATQMYMAKFRFEFLSDTLPISCSSCSQIKGGWGPKKKKKKSLKRLRIKERAVR